MALGLAAWYIHGSLPNTLANGPGRRYALWVQGCNLGCNGCFNPGTHPVGSGATTTGLIFRELLAALPVDGVTITGGEPLQQPAALADFLNLLKADPRTVDLSVVLITGYSTEEIQSDPQLSSATTEVDTLVTGRYNSRLHLAVGLKGSSNKEYWHRSGRHTDSEFEAIPACEISFLPDGSVTITGMYAVAEAMNS